MANLVNNAKRSTRSKVLVLRRRLAGALALRFGEET